MSRPRTFQPIFPRYCSLVPRPYAWAVSTCRRGRAVSQQRTEGIDTKKAHFVVPVGLKSVKYGFDTFEGSNAGACVRPVSLMATKPSVLSTATETRNRAPSFPASPNVMAPYTVQIMSVATTECWKSCTMTIFNALFCSGRDMFSLAFVVCVPSLWTKRLQ